MMIRFAKAPLIVCCLALLPLTSEARGNAVEQCVQSVVSQVVPEGLPVIVKRDIRSIPTAFTSHSKVFITARGEETGKTYGRAVCTIDRMGNLVAIDMGDLRGRNLSARVTSAR
jgi:hypothetical protein